MFSRVRKIFPNLITNIKFNFGPKKIGKDKIYHPPHLTKKEAAQNKNQSHLQIGLYGIVFALCFAAIPLYRTFCQHVGLIGNNDKKVYDFKNKQIVNLKKYQVRFIGSPQAGINWQFVPVEKEVVIGASQTAIVFYRLRNRQDRPIVGFSTYSIAPEEANTYFSKIQCFCFNQQMINPQQQLLLPLFFYLQPEINEDPDVSRIHEITVNYHFHESSNQDLAKFAEEELKRVEQNKRKLKQIRASKKGMSIQKYELQMEEENRELEDEPLIIEKSLPKQSKVALAPKVEGK